jgi:flagellar basal-body rod protein FlgB
LELIGGGVSVFNRVGMSVLERSLDASLMRQNAIANNIANVDTPNFKRSEVRFESILKNELQKTNSKFIGFRSDPRHLPIGQPSFMNIRPQTIMDGSSVINNNLNNVDIDYEMSQLAKNTLAYNVLTQQLNSEFRKMKLVLEGR